MSDNAAELHLSMTCPPIVEGDDRMVRALEVMEKLFPEHLLRYEIPMAANVPMVLKVEDPASRLPGRAKIRPGDEHPFPFLISDEDCHTTFEPSPGSLGIDLKRSVPHAIDRSYELMKQVGSILRGRLGRLGRNDTNFYTIRQYPRPDPRFAGERPSFGLPILYRQDDDVPWIRPGALHWINYWSPESCRLVGTPDPARDAAFMHRAEQLDDGSWIWQLTADPTDLERPEHLQAMLAAYERFPAIGHRDDR